MTIVEMLVGLKIPDSTALSARQALHEMGFRQLSGLARYAYYSFEVEGSAEQFRKKISGVDILANANKHSVSFGMPREGIRALVQDREKPDGLMSTLRERLGVREIKGMGVGTLWVFSIDGKSQKEAAKRMTEELLVNPHYQRYSFLVAGKDASEQKAAKDL